MLIRRFEAETTPEALNAVKAALGPDAVILSTRALRARRGRFGLLSKPMVEVTAAIERDAPDDSDPPSRRAPDDSWRALQISRALVSPLEDELRALRETVERSVAPPAQAPSFAHEIAELRRVARALAARVPEARADDPESHYLSAGISPALAFELGIDVRARIHDGSPRDEAVVDALADRLEPKLAPARPDDGHRLVIGAPGVGKTTSVAKQAAVDCDKRTRLITTDTHRLGGSATLRGLGKALGVKVDAASNPEAVARIARKRRARLIVDTPGSAQNDEDGMFELLRTAHALGDGARVQHVLSANTKESDLRRELSRFACVAPDSLIVTRLDDSTELGNVVNVLLEEATPPIAWIGNGQRVPEDLEIPDPHDFALQVLRVCP